MIRSSSDVLRFVETRKEKGGGFQKTATHLILSKYYFARLKQSHIPLAHAPVTGSQGTPVGQCSHPGIGIGSWAKTIKTRVHEHKYDTGKQNQTPCNIMRFLKLIQCLMCVSSYLLIYSCIHHRRSRFDNVYFFGIGTLKLQFIRLNVLKTLLVLTRFVVISGSGNKTCIGLEKYG